MSLIHHEKTQITLDTETGLMWQDDIDAKELRLNLTEAQEYCKNLRLGGFSDWEIPNTNVLLNLAKKTGDDSKEELRNNIAHNYVTSAIFVNTRRVVSFLHKYSKTWAKNHSTHIRCVRNKKLKSIEINEVLYFRRINENSIILSSLEEELYYLKYDNNEYFGFFYEILEKIHFSKIENSANISEIINQRLEQKISDYLKVDEIQEPNFDLSIKDNFIKDEFESQAEFDERVNQFIEIQETEYKKKLEIQKIEYKNRVENLGDIKKDFLFEIFAQTMGNRLLKDALYDAETNDMNMTLFMTNCLWEKRIKVNIPNRTLAKDFKTKLNEVKVDVTFNLENEEFIFDKVELEFDNNKFTAVESKEQEKQEEEIKIDFKLVADERGLKTSKDTQLLKYSLEVKTLDNQKLEDEIMRLENNINLSNEETEDFEFKYKELEEKYQNILKDNQLLKYEIEELKKYCKELELNASSSKEQEKQSKIVERESFSDF